MPNLPPYFKSIFSALLALGAAIISVLTTLQIVHWSSSQTTLVGTATAATITFIGALLAHFYPNTKQESVALAATFTAVFSSVLALGTGFTWWHLDAEPTAALVSFVASFIGIGSSVFARQKVVAKVTGS